MKPYIIIFDGLDKTGKSTLKDAFNKATNYLHFVIDRGPLSNLVYNTIFNRNHNIDYSKMINHLSLFDHLIVLCTAPEDLVQKRLKDNNEMLPNNSTFKDTKKMFEDFLYQSPFNYVIIDTSQPIENCIKQIIQKLEKGDF